MCRQLGLPRATYYRRLDAGDTPTALRRRELTDQVKTVFDSSDGIFGHRMVHAKLAAAGIEVSVGTVAGIMAENGWAAKRMRAFKRTTIASDPDKVFEDLIGRDFTAEAPGTRLVGDITYLRTGEGWLYLATVIDLCTRMVVGWAMAEHMRASLVTGALTMARDSGHLSPNAIFHSDHGTQGGFNWSSQHLDHGGVVWPSVRTRKRLVGDGSGRLTVRCGLRCAHQGARTRRGRCSVSFGG